MVKEIGGEHKRKILEEGGYFKPTTAVIGLGETVTLKFDHKDTGSPNYREFFIQGQYEKDSDSSFYDLRAQVSGKSLYFFLDTFSEVDTSGGQEEFLNNSLDWATGYAISSALHEICLVIDRRYKGWLLAFAKERKFILEQTVKENAAKPVFIGDRRGVNAQEKQVYVFRLPD